MVSGWVWWGSDLAGSYVAMIGLYIVTDDLREHFFGWPMPLDRAFKRAMQYPAFRRYYRIALCRIYG